MLALNPSSDLSSSNGSEITLRSDTVPVPDDRSAQIQPISVKCMNPTTYGISKLTGRPRNDPNV